MWVHRPRTALVQGNCTAQPTGALDPPRKTNTQCVILIREDFLEVVAEGALIWISDLYVKLIGVEKGHSTLIGLTKGDMYLTDMTFVGDRDKARAIDVSSNHRLYVSGQILVLSFLRCVCSKLWFEDRCSCFWKYQKICLGTQDAIEVIRCA